MRNSAKVEAARTASPNAQVADAPGARTRVVAIDILRGLAILWVMSFHLWSDMTIPVGGTEALYYPFRDQLREGHFLGALTAFGEIILGHGYLGVPLFMMLSGLSLTMNAYRRGEPGILRGYWNRFRRIVPVYWAGILLFVGAVALVAFLQMVLDGGSFRYQWFHVTMAIWVPIRLQWDDIVWALTVFLPIFRDKNDPVALTVFPVCSLWFVPLLLQYYLIFPFALRLLRKIGPLPLALTGIALTVAFHGMYLPWSRGAFEPDYALRYSRDLAPFRLAEFFIGMSLGHVIALRRDDLSRLVRSSWDLTGLVVAGVVLVVGAMMISGAGDPQLLASEVMIPVGLALVIIPLLFKSPGRLETSLLARTLVVVGVISFTALIVDDMMRIFASFLRNEGMTGWAWWFFLTVVYIPGGTLMAYPLAKVFGLLPSQRGSPQAGTPVGARATSPSLSGRLVPIRRRVQ